MYRIQNTQYNIPSVDDEMSCSNRQILIEIIKSKNLKETLRGIIKRCHPDRNSGVNQQFFGLILKLYNRVNHSKKER